MKLTFKAATQQSIHIVGFSPLREGDQIDISKEKGDALLKQFPNDFAEDKNAIVKNNKQYQKTISFKSK